MRTNLQSCLMFGRKRAASLLVVMMLSVAAVGAAAPDEPVDLGMVTRIRQEGFRNSRAMQTVSELTDRFGARLTGSPNLKQADEWAGQQLTSWGLQNVHLESAPFGRGWVLEAVSVRMVTPEPAPLFALPKAWSAATAGAVRAPAVILRAKTKEDLVKLKGTLAGKIVLVGEPREVKPLTDPLFRRYDDKKLEEISQYQAEAYPGDWRRQERQRWAFSQELRRFLADEKVAAAIEPSRGDGVLLVQGTGAYHKEDAAGAPSLVMSLEQYGRVWRLLEQKVAVELEVDVRSRFLDDDANGYNVIAEIPGTDKKDELVMVGAHMDSWHAGTGATDDGAGVAVTMEAMRILAALGVRPRRTIRIGLWFGEEQGLLGSEAYVAEHFASRAEPEDAAQRALPRWMRTERGVLTIKPEHAKVSAYYNIDAGTGKLRGIYCQDNAAVEPIFEAWARPFRDVGFTTITLRGMIGSDFASFDNVGIPGFQFIQDPADYFTRSHHSNLDVLERIQPEDLMQASVVLASFLYHTAMRDELLPRKPLPKEAVVAAAKSETGEPAPAKKKK